MLVLVFVYELQHINVLVLVLVRAQHTHDTGIRIRARTFQSFRLAIRSVNTQRLNALQTAVSRIAFYDAINDSFAMFTSTVDRPMQVHQEYLYN